jgi:hypothetical protein
MNPRNLCQTREYETQIAAMHEFGSDAVDGSSTGTRVPSMFYCSAYVSSWHTASNRCGAKVRTRSLRSGHAESVGSGSI